MNQTWTHVSQSLLSYHDLCAKVSIITKQIPCSFKIITLCQTPENRDIFAIHVRPKGWHVTQPTLWVDANMHAAELVGTNVVLAQLCDLIELLQKQPASVENCNYIFIPRICPDGAERFFEDGRPCRSNPRENRSPDLLGSRWRRTCLMPKPKRNVTGFPVFQNPHRMGHMRQQSPFGAWTYDEIYPLLLRRRFPGDSGPFFHIFPEGTIEPYDGSSIPLNHLTWDNEVDLNRNFPTEWEPGGCTTRSGAFALSEPEARAITEHFVAHPEIFFCMNYHTCGGVFIRPPSAKPDTSLPRGDRSIYEFLDKQLEQLTGYPGVSGAAEFQYEPGVPLPGTWTSFTYHSRGALSYVCELWDLPKRLGHQERPFVNRYTHWDKETWRRFYEFDLKEYDGAFFKTQWQRHEHSQLGAVELGDYPVFVSSNPPPHLMESVIEPQIRVFRLLTQLAPIPALEVQESPQKAEANQNSDLMIQIGNKGYLPTYVSEESFCYFGKTSPIVRIKNLSNEKVIIKKIPELGGFFSPNTGWIDFPTTGAQEAQSIRLVFPKAGLGSPGDTLNISVTFSRCGTVHCTYTL